MSGVVNVFWLVGLVVDWGGILGFFLEGGCVWLGDLC